MIKMLFYDVFFYPQNEINYIEEFAGNFVSVKSINSGTLSLYPKKFSNISSEVIVCENERCVFVIDKLLTIGFNSHLHAYNVKTSEGNVRMNLP